MKDKLTRSWTISRTIFVLIVDIDSLERVFVADSRVVTSSSVSQFILYLYRVRVQYYTIFDIFIAFHDIFCFT